MVQGSGGMGDSVEIIMDMLLRELWNFATVLCRSSRRRPTTLCTGRQRGFKRRAVPLWYDHNNCSLKWALLSSLLAL